MYVLTIIKLILTQYIVDGEQPDQQIEGVKYVTQQSFIEGKYQIAKLYHVYCLKQLHSGTTMDNLIIKEQQKISKEIQRTKLYQNTILTSDGVCVLVYEIIKINSKYYATGAFLLRKSASEFVLTNSSVCIPIFEDVKIFGATYLLLNRALYYVKLSQLKQNALIVAQTKLKIFQSIQIAAIQSDLTKVQTVNCVCGQQVQLQFLVTQNINVPCAECFAKSTLLINTDRFKNIYVDCSNPNDPVTKFRSDKVISKYFQQKYLYGSAIQPTKSISTDRVPLIVTKTVEINKSETVKSEAPAIVLPESKMSIFKQFKTDQQNNLNQTEQSQQKISKSTPNQPLNPTCTVQPPEERLKNAQATRKNRSAGEEIKYPPNNQIQIPAKSNTPSQPVKPTDSLPLPKQQSPLQDLEPPTKCPAPKQQFTIPNSILLAQFRAQIQAGAFTLNEIESNISQGPNQYQGLMKLITDDAPLKIQILETFSTNVKPKLNKVQQSIQNVLHLINHKEKMALLNDLTQVELNLIQQGVKPVISTQNHSFPLSQQAKTSLFKLRLKNSQNYIADLQLLLSKQIKKAEDDISEIEATRRAIAELKTIHKKMDTLLQFEKQEVERHERGITQSEAQLNEAQTKLKELQDKAPEDEQTLKGMDKEFLETKFQEIIMLQ
ncbi:Hypothetical_protein [Hexamita inflata]|uniref:Hypothetical_protein n=1 Tax=Hexamita inflata TaxID=28002 RepID=A0ABP1GGM2_9EUKA